jgi:hypothetical protein
MDKRWIIFLFSLIQIISTLIFFYNSTLILPHGSPEAQQFARNMSIVFIIMVLSYVVTWIIIAKDIIEKGKSKALILLPFLLGGLGGIIYILINPKRATNVKDTKVSGSQISQQEV